MIVISEATAEDFPVIQKIAYETWPVAYGAILSKAQLDYMLGLFYSTQMLQKNFQNRHRFLLVSEHAQVLGFASYEHHYNQMNVTRLHKLYVLPESQGKGAGLVLLSEVEKLAREVMSSAISLNVNRFNKAYFFYLKNNYEVVGEIDLPIGGGFLMEDYMMQKKI